MDASARSSSKRSSRFAVALALVAAACVEELPPLEGTTSLRIDLAQPVDPGAPDARLGDAERTLELTATALDTRGEIDIDFSGDIDVYVHFLGSLTPRIGSPPLVVARIDKGVSGPIALELPRVYGPSFLWLEHARGDEPTFATGTSPTLWYREPFLVDVSRPEDESALDALERSPLEGKEVRISDSQYGAAGRMVVTGVYAQGYTVSDVQCQDEDAAPPCTTGDYDHLFIFTFGRPSIEGGGTVRTGHVVTRVSGGVLEFNGLTELGFPTTQVADRTIRRELLPEPFVLDPSWLSAPNRIMMERVESALVAVDGATVCPLDEDFGIYSQWKLDVGSGCANIGSVISVISSGQVADFSPGDHVGQTLPRVVGTLRPINIGNFHVWLLYPREAGDIVLP
jgi:hypothetical protein